MVYKGGAATTLRQWLNRTNLNVAFMAAY